MHEKCSCGQQCRKADKRSGENAYRGIPTSRNILLIGPIVKQNLELVNGVARRYVKLSGNNSVYKDLVGVGVLELIGALNEYRPDGSSDFVAYADPLVRRAILKEIHRFNGTRTVRNVWRRLANITFINTCRNCKRQCVY
jgi:DNA-directed RNA polymerase specialized sigma subunit